LRVLSWSRSLGRSPFSQKKSYMPFYCHSIFYIYIFLQNPNIVFPTLAISDKFQQTKAYVNKCVKDTNPPYGVVHFPGGVTYIFKALVELMLSSNWHITLRLTVFETFAVKWPKMSDLGIPGVPPQTGEDLSGTDHIKFHADRCHRRRDNLTGRRKQQQPIIPFNIACNLWRVIRCSFSSRKVSALWQTRKHPNFPWLRHRLD